MGYKDGRFLLLFDDPADIVADVEPGLIIQGGEGFI